MKAIVVTCPHCGARLRTDGTLDQVVCEYCGTASRLQRRTRVLERVIPAPEAPHLPRQVAVQRRTFVVPLIATAVTATVSTVLVPIMARRAQHAVPQGSVATPGRSDDNAVGWQGTDGAIVIDIDGDSAREVIGRGRRVRNGDTVTLIALSTSGKLRWESEPLGTYESTYQGPLALAGELLLFATARGEVRAYNVADGKRRWAAQLPERTKHFCDAGDTVIAVGADDVQRALRRSDGTATTVSAVEPPQKGRAKGKAGCKPVASDKDAYGDWWEMREFAEKHGLSGSSHKLIDTPRGRVIAGTRNKGTAVPTLVAVDERNQQRWRVDVPLDPLAAQTNAPVKLAAGDETVCTVYHAESITKPLDATCFALADGRRLWNKQIQSHYASTLVIIDRLLLISWSGTLEARDLATGDVRWRFGR